MAFLDDATICSSKQSAIHLLLDVTTRRKVTGQKVTGVATAIAPGQDYSLKGNNLGIEGEVKEYNECQLTTSKVSPSIGWGNGR
jgi:hypothetical protein